VVKVTWTERASKDLLAVYEFIASDNKIAARRVVRQLIRITERLVQFPGSGRLVPKARESVRELVVRPYIVAYERISDDEIAILKIRHGARMPHEGDE
jgi:plasmid stabilization system protein ParE